MPTGPGQPRSLQPYGRPHMLFNLAARALLGIQVMRACKLAYVGVCYPIIRCCRRAAPAAGIG